jgi:hypothetical protein
MSLRVTGSAASLEATSVIVPQCGAQLRVTAGDQVLMEEKAADGENSYTRQLEHLVAVLRDGSPSPLDAALGVGTMRVVDDVCRSATALSRPCSGRRARAGCVSDRMSLGVGSATICRTRACTSADTRRARPQLSWL